MEREKRISLARSVRWRRIRSQTVPVLSFLLAVAASGWLWQRCGVTAQGVGEVDSPRVVVTSPSAGLVVSLPNHAGRPWMAYDRVQQGDVIARIEDPLTAKSQEIQSPISGTLIAVHCWPGQTLPPGALIATIAADYGRHIIGYIPEGSSLIARPGMRVSLRTRTAGSRRLTSQIETIGTQIERIPSHQRAVSTTPQWGTPVRITMPSDAVLRPGALVDVVFEGSGQR